MTILFFITLSIITLNLGLHFELFGSYVQGLLVDYLVPTLYVQDIFVFVYVILSLQQFKKFLLKNLGDITFTLLVWFIFTVFLSFLPLFYTSLDLFKIAFVHFVRLVLYILFALLVSYNIRFEVLYRKIIVVMTCVLLFVSLLGLAQWIKQGAVFNNYLFFGEQPYNFSTFQIKKEAFFGSTRIPPYATFRHPNTLGGFLSVVLLWTYSQIKRKRVYIIPFSIGVTVLALTLSQIAWVATFLGITYFHLIKRGKVNITLAVTLAIFLIGMLWPLLPQVNSFNEDPSFSKRASLIKEVWHAFPNASLFGIGYGVSTAFIPNHFLTPQPVHNIFYLLISETGLIAFLLFGLVYLLKLSIAKNTSPLLYISLSQFIILGSFDHYIFTSQQMLLLFWLVFGLV